MEPIFNDSYALTKDELNKYIDDPWWIKMRYCAFATCWIVCLVALGISLYIAADALQHDTCNTPLTNNNGTSVPAALTISTTSMPLADVTASTPPTSIVFALLSQPTA
uniref:Solute carrier family 3 member 2 N-terminal domain-containing protein n=1 Tax=Anopheles christyi TaxID=43041 RepID=A0A182KGX8_9DIPT